MYHELIYCDRKLNWQRAPSQIKTFRNYANYNLAHFCDDLKGLWSNDSIPMGSRPVSISSAGFQERFCFCGLWLIVTYLSYKDVCEG